MSKLLALSLTICCIFLLQYVCDCQASSDDFDNFFFSSLFSDGDENEDSSQSSSSEEEEKQIDSWRRHKHHHHSHIRLDICKCHNESCKCCIKFSKYQICDNLRLVYPSNGSQSLAIDFDISINNNTLFSDAVSLKNLPAFCYRAANIGVCFKLITKTVKCDNEKKVELCGDVQLKFNSEVLAHINVLCFKIKKDFKMIEDYEEDNEETKRIGHLED